MALTAGKAVVEIVGDLDGLKRDLNSVDRMASTTATNVGNSFNSKLGAFNSKFKTATANVSRTIGRSLPLIGAAVGGGLTYAAQAASALNEQMDFNEVVFGKAHDAMVAWSDQALESMGLARVTALGAANDFGIFLTKMGNSKEEAAALSQTLTNLAVDMSSAKDVRLEESLGAIASALAGESEPMRRFGVDLRMAALQQFALKEGIIGAKEELKGQSVQTAILGKILQDTAVFQGNYADTANSAANAQRRAGESAKDAAAKMGEDLAPILATLASKAAQYASVLADVVTVGDKQRESVNQSLNLIEAQAIAVQKGRMSLDDFKESVEALAREEGISMPQRAELLDQYGRMLEMIENGEHITNAAAQSNRELTQTINGQASAAQKLAAQIELLQRRWEEFTATVGTASQLAPFSYIGGAVPSLAPSSGGAQGPQSGRSSNRGNGSSSGGLALQSLQVNVDVDGQRISKTVETHSRRTKIVLGGRP